MTDYNQASGTGGSGNASASTTQSYHNGGVEGDSFAQWYDDNLSQQMGDVGADTCDTEEAGTVLDLSQAGSHIILNVTTNEDGTQNGSVEFLSDDGTPVAWGHFSNVSEILLPESDNGYGYTEADLDVIGDHGPGLPVKVSLDDFLRECDPEEPEEPIGSGSGGTKGSGSGGTKGSGSGGTKGSGSGGTKGSGSGGTKGSGSGGTKGSGSGGTKGSGSGGTKGSGSGGTKGSGSGGTKGSGSGGTKGSGSGGTKGSGSGGTKGSGSGGTKGSGSGGTKGSGSGGTKGSGSGGTKGSGSGGTKGSGSGGTKGSGSGGTKGSGSGGTKGSGSGGTKGSGSGGTKGSGSGGTKGSACYDGSGSGGNTNVTWGLPTYKAYPEDGDSYADLMNQEPEEDDATTGTATHSGSSADYYEIW
ncbi:hypothetical protein [Roseivivax sp. CAU 1753]